MMWRPRTPGWAVRRVLENAGILIFASLAVMSLVLGRYSGALVWCGALVVFFAHAWETRAPRRFDEVSTTAIVEAAHPRHFDALRWLGIALAFAGTALSL